jgi:RNA polymerase sigma-70 factor (ECF subfamily)
MTALEFQHSIIQQQSALEVFTRKFTNNHDESQDLVQETILKALTYKDKFQPNTNLKGWLYTIMKNTFINNYRKTKRSQTIHDDSETSYYLNTEDLHTFSNPESTSRYNDITDKIAGIREEYQRPFMLHVEGFKYNEIAEKLDIPVGTVKNRIFHARQELQRILN